MGASTTVTSSMVTSTRVWTEGGVTGKERIGMLVKIADATNGLTVGSLTNTIPVAAFDLSKIESVSCIGLHTTATGALTKLYAAAPGTNGTLILSVADGADTPADITVATTEHLELEIHGYR